MFTSLRFRLLIASVAVIILALVLNTAASYLTVKSHNDDQVAGNLAAVASGNAQAIGQWLEARTTMLEALPAPGPGDDPLPALRQLAARDAMADIASGHADLTRRLPEAGRDEVAQIAEAFNRFVSRMERVMRTIRDSSQQVRLAAGEITHGNQDLSRRTESAAASLQQSSASIEQISSTVGHTADSAREANGLSQSAAEVAGRSGEEMRQVVATMEAIRDASGQIAAIVKVMDGIAFQTNLQALVERVARVAEVLGEISAATGEQSDGIGQVNLAVADLDRVTQQNAALVEESTVAAEQLKEQADRLAEAVGSFTIGESKDGAGQAAPRVSREANRPLVAEPA